MSITIIGGGIAGLSLAVALEKKGINYHLYEQTAELRPVGAGIILANNAMQVYRHLGISDVLKQAGHPISMIHLTDAKLNALTSTNLSLFEEKYKLTNLAIHRAALIDILKSHIDPQKLILDAKLEEIEFNNFSREYFLKFKNQQETKTKILIGADGINSQVRNKLFPKRKIRLTNQVCWRGIGKFDPPHNFKAELTEAWGKAKRFGFVPLDDQTVYWYALKNKEANDLHDLNKLKTLFRNFHPSVTSILSQTNGKVIHKSVISDLEPSKNWYDDQVCLMGDAAHATTPNMGQGACQAIEDAYVLSECLSRYETPMAFKNFQMLRLKKVNQIVKTSWNLGAVAHWANPIMIGFRNTLMRLTPNSLGQSQLKSIFTLTKFD